jgi:hypothetical protein
MNSLRHSDAAGPSQYALSVRQPWAELILCGKKSIELRSWSTAYRGQLWLHTGRQGDPELEKSFGLSHLFTGGYVGAVILTAVVPMDQDRWESWRFKHLDPSPYQAGMYAWVLASPLRFEEPVSGPGQLRLFLPPREIETQLRRARDGVLRSGN